MAQDDAHISGAGRSRRFDEFLLPERKKGRADDAGQTHPGKNADDEGDRCDAALQRSQLCRADQGAEDDQHEEFGGNRGTRRSGA